MPSDLDSAGSDPEVSASTPEDTAPGRTTNWFKVGAVAAASAVAGGLAAAWFYRKTLTRLQQAAEDGHSPEISTAAPEDD
jgi:hypothetical protein